MYLNLAEYIGHNLRSASMLVVWDALKVYIRGITVKFVGNRNRGLRDREEQGTDKLARLEREHDVAILAKDLDYGYSQIFSKEPQSMVCGVNEGCTNTSRVTVRQFGV